MISFWKRATSGRQRWVTGLSTVAVAATLSVTWMAAAAPTDRSETYRQLNLFGDVFERVRANYVDEIDVKDLIEAAINGMLTSLDPHSSYLNAKVSRTCRSKPAASLAVSASKVTMEGLIKVVSPIDGTPAFKAGLKPGDYISHIDGDAILGLTLSEAVDRMRGPVDSNITITIRRAGEEPFDVTLQRAVIKLRSVRSRVFDDVGYVRITTFNEQTVTSLETAMAVLRDKLGGMGAGYVIDLRNNPGGY